jgi:hypothetical protein
MQTLCALLTVDGPFPTRRTGGRRVHAIPATLPAQIAWPGRALVAAIDSTLLRARGGVWQKQDREAGLVPHTSIDTEAHWTKSGWDE